MADAYTAAGTIVEGYTAEQMAMMVELAALRRQKTAPVETAPVEAAALDTTPVVNALSETPPPIDAPAPISTGRKLAAAVGVGIILYFLLKKRS